MIKNTVCCFLVGLFVLAGSITAKAERINPVTDTLPPNNKKPEESNEKKAAEIIKEVPKSRKQEKPLAVTPVIIKPVTVKPKIVVKPVIKVHI